MILARATVWIHGISGQVECPERLEWARRIGFSLRAQSKEASHNWFHFAIPTPRILDDTRFRVWGLSVSVLVGLGPDGREIEFSAAGYDFVA
jgi:hypothetical protein